MCGRYTLSDPEEALTELLEGETDLEVEPRFNAAPTEAMPVVRRGRTAPREAAVLRWGLIPPGAASPQVGARMINARSETVAEKPAFRASFYTRRCLVPADGFFEWQRRGRAKQPFFFRRRDRSPFAFAGLWAVWRRQAESIESFTILTTTANACVAEIHDRMPVILPRRHHATWLGLEGEDPEPLLALLQPLPAAEIESFTVGTAVNRAGTDHPSMIEPAKPLPENLSLFD